MLFEIKHFKENGEYAPNLEIDIPFGPVTDVAGVTSDGASRHDFTFQIQICPG